MSSPSLTSGFVDIATWDELEKHMYGHGSEARTYFIRDIQKSNWFTQVPTTLQKVGGHTDFGQTFSANITRAGDYLLQAWLRVELPSLQLTHDGANEFRLVRWCSNVGHNLLEEVSIKFNDLVAAKMQPAFLDFWAAFTTPAGKQAAYANMIGDTEILTTPTGDYINVANDKKIIPAAVLNINIPMFFSRDSGVSLPTAALPYNDMKFEFKFRSWDKLIIIEDVGTAAKYAKGTSSVVSTTASQFVGGAPTLSKVEVWANYAIVSNAERSSMGCTPRTIVIEQVQEVNPQSFSPATSPQQTYDLRLAHAIKTLLFGIQNTTNGAEWSNYTTHSSAYTSGGVAGFKSFLETGEDPISTVTLRYENTHRLSEMPNDYFSMVNPFYHAPVVTRKTGYHTYNYTLAMGNIDPMGSTNYGKLTNVSLSVTGRTTAINANATGGFDTDVSTDRGITFKQTYRFLCYAINHNLIVIRGGVLGFPVL